MVNPPFTSSPAWRLIAAAALAVLLTTSSGEVPASATPRLEQTNASIIAGTLRLGGCVADPSAIKLWARGLAAAGRRTVGAPLSFQARMMATRFPHRFQFLIHGVPQHTAVELSVSVAEEANCGAIFWRGPFAGIVLGGDTAVSIEGLAATTELEVLQPASDEWAGAEALDFTSLAAGIRQFRWRSRVPGVSGGELQLSSSKFPNEGAFNSCDEPAEGIFYRRAVSGGDGAWTDTGPVSFGEIIGRNGGGGSSPVSSGTYRKLLLGAPVYARVVPQIATGAACDSETYGVPAWVIFSKLGIDITDLVLPPDPPTLQPGNGHEYIPPQFKYLSENAGRPVLGDRAFKFIKTRQLPSVDFCLNKTGVSPSTDPLGCFFVGHKIYAGGTVVGPPMWVAYRYDFGPSAGGTSIGGVFGSFVTGLVNAVGVVVTGVADLWNGAVAGAKSLAFDALITLPGVGQFCSSHPDECKKGVDLGVTIALASAGMPPSLPNWDEVKSEGRDYLAAMVADEIEEATGVPAPLTEGALKLLADHAIQQMSDARGGSDKKYDWVQRYFGLDPAVWVLAIQKNGTDPVHNLVFKRNKGTLYGGGELPVPRWFPPPPPGSSTSTLRIPIVLHSHLDGIPMPACKTDENGNTTCVPSPFLSKPFCEAASFQGTFKYFPRPCEFTDYPELYFRDQWATRFGQQACTTISGVTLQNTNGIYLVNQLASFFVGAAVPPGVGGQWSGTFINACPK